jgi:hypothetical protein
MQQKRPSMAKSKTNTPPVPGVPTESEIGEAAMEHAWKVSGDLHVIANTIGFCLLRDEPPPAWVHKALLDLANASIDTKPYAKQARSLVRYVAVREAHDQEGLSWEDAKDRAVEMLRSQPAAANRDWMWKEYMKVRKALRDAGAVRNDDDPGYRWIDLPANDPLDKS